VSSGYSPPVKFRNRRSTGGNSTQRINLDKINYTSKVDILNQELIRIAVNVQQMHRKDVIQVYTPNLII